MAEDDDDEDDVDVKSDAMSRMASCPDKPGLLGTRANKLNAAFGAARFASLASRLVIFLRIFAKRSSCVAPRERVRRRWETARSKSSMGSLASVSMCSVCDRGKCVWRT